MSTRSGCASPSPSMTMHLVSSSHRTILPTAVFPRCACPRRGTGRSEPGHDQHLCQTLCDCNANCTAYEWGNDCYLSTGVVQPACLDTDSRVNPTPHTHPTPPQLTRARVADPLLPISIQQHAPPWMPDRLQSSYLLHQGDTTVATSPASAVGGQGPEACLRNTRRGAASPRKATPRGPRACIPPLWPPLAPLRATTARSRAAAAAPALPAADGRGRGQRPRRRQRRHRGRVYLRRGVLLPLAPAPGTAHPGVSGCGREIGTGLMS